MINIVICTNEKCLQKKKCYRYVAVPKNKNQKYERFMPDKKGKCEHHIFVVKKNGRLLRSHIINKKLR